MILNRRVCENECEQILEARLFVLFFFNSFQDNTEISIFFTRKKKDKRCSSLSEAFTFKNVYYALLSSKFMQNRLCLYQDNNPGDVSDNLYILSSTAVTVNAITKLFF